MAEKIEFEFYVTKFKFYFPVMQIVDLRFFGGFLRKIRLYRVRVPKCKLHTAKLPCVIFVQGVAPCVRKSIFYRCIDPDYSTFFDSKEYFAYMRAVYAHAILEIIISVGITLLLYYFRATSLNYILTIFTIILLVEEIIQISTNKNKYVKNWKNWMELIIIILVLTILLYKYVLGIKLTQNFDNFHTISYFQFFGGMQNYIQRFECMCHCAMFNGTSNFVQQKSSTIKVCMSASNSIGYLVMPF